MHLLFQAIFLPLEQWNITLSLSKICKAWNLFGIGKLRRVPPRQICYPWMFEWCKGTCPLGHENLMASKILDDFPFELYHQIKDGEQTIITIVDGRTIDKSNKKRLKTEGYGLWLKEWVYSKRRLQTPSCTSKAVPLRKCKSPPALTPQRLSVPISALQENTEIYDLDTSPVQLKVVLPENQNRSDIAGKFNGLMWTDELLHSAAPMLLDYTKLVCSMDFGR